MKELVVNNNTLFYSCNRSKKDYNSITSEEQIHRIAPLGDTRYYSTADILAKYLVLIIILFHYLLLMIGSKELYLESKEKEAELERLRVQQREERN